MHAPTDALWVGAAVLTRQDDFNRETLKAHRTVAEQDCTPRRYFEVKDLLRDERFATHACVVREPHARAYVGVPLISPTGYPIGTLSLLDDHPRETNVKDAEVVFLQDIAKTIVSHLEMARTSITHARGLTMVKGLSRFVEGKEGLNENAGIAYRDMEDMHNRHATQTAGLYASHRTHALNAASNAERADDAFRERPEYNERRPSSPGHNDTFNIQESRNSIADPHHPESPKAQSPKTTSPKAPSRPTELSAALSTSSRQPQLLPGHAPAHTQENLVSKDVKHAFERAAHIINRAMDMSSVLFLDATISEFGRLRSGGGEYSSSSPESDASTKPRSRRSSVSRDDADNGNSTQDSVPSKGVLHSDSRRGSVSGNELHNSNSSQGSVSGDDLDNSNTDSKVTPKACATLASAYDNALLRRGKSRVLHRPIPERFLKSLLRRFPYGKIWTFDITGSTSSDDHSDSSAATDKTEKETTTKAVEVHRKRPRVHRDGALLAKLFPGVRSLAVMPMYDALRERFFAGAVVWTYDPIRILTVQEDLNYLGAFCDVIMAEVGRLDAQAEAHAKTSFISSISHELKSPLHGILGGVECLQDRDSASIQDEMLDMIEASGKSLLDVIDHLLEHAHATSSDKRSSKPNKIERNREGSSFKRGKGLPGTSFLHQPLSNLAVLTEEVLDGLFWQTPKPTPLSNAGERPALGRAKANPPIKVILEIDPGNLNDSGWWCRVNAGAWRRIVQNLAANSIKYTDTGGYLKMSMSIHPRHARAEYDTENAPMMVELVCLDSGRGMSAQYLKYGLWQAFSQEDEHSQGSGLGLSLVHGIVKEIGGKIDVQSRKGEGTAIRVKVPFVPGQPSSSQSDKIIDPATKDRLKASRFAMLGFGGDDQSEVRTMQATAALQDSITAACKGHGVQPAEDETQADIFILLEQKASALAKFGPLNDIERAACEKPAILLCSSVASSRALTNAGTSRIGNAIPVAQPLGPRKLLKALIACLEKTPPRRSAEGAESPNVITSPMSPATPLQMTPSQPRPVAQTSTSSQSTSSKPMSGLATLLVDDNDLNLSLLRTYMKKNRHAYVCAYDGVEAVSTYKHAYGQQQLYLDYQPQRLDEKPVMPTVVLMDITMPVMDGLEATRQIRAFERSRRMQPSMIIALTAMGSSEAKQEAFSSGVDLFLTKPVKLKELTAILEEFIERPPKEDGKKENGT